MSPSTQSLLSSHPHFHLTCLNPASGHWEAHPQAVTLCYCLEESGCGPGSLVVQVAGALGRGKLKTPAKSCRDVGAKHSRASKVQFEESQRLTETWLLLERLCHGQTDAT